MKEPKVTMRMQFSTPDTEWRYEFDDRWFIVIRASGGVNLYRPDWSREFKPYSAEELRIAGEHLQQIAEMRAKSDLG